MKPVSRILLALLLISVIGAQVHSKTESIEKLRGAVDAKSDLLAAPEEACVIGNDNSVGLGFFRFFKIGQRVVTYYDPGDCGPAAYPYEVTRFHLTLLTIPESVWPLTIDLILYDVTDTADLCLGPGTELFREQVVVDSFTFEFPFLGTIVLPEPICVTGPFYAGFEYAETDSAQFPSVLFDDSELQDTCYNWIYTGTEWKEFDIFWGNGPGYPIIRITGETESAACCPDSDSDSICDPDDNCPALANSGQQDSDADGIGDLCDNCPSVSNAAQLDFDNDGTGDSCDLCPEDPLNDFDGDGICGDLDNCPCDANPGQLDIDLDGVGDICQACCTGFTGDLFGPGDGLRNLADITRLIDRVYISKARLCCERAGNVDGDLDNNVNLADITKLIDHVYLSKAATAACQ